MHTLAGTLQIFVMVAFYIHWVWGLLLVLEPEVSS
jgi:hypothetical protein